MHRNHVVDGDVAAHPGERDTHLWTGRGSAGRADVRGVLDVEERWNLRLVDKPHRVLIEQAVALDGGRRAEDRPPRSTMSLPSSTDASESKKKLQ